MVIWIVILIMNFNPNNSLFRVQKIINRKWSIGTSSNTGYTVVLKALLRFYGQFSDYSIKILKGRKK